MTLIQKLEQVNGAKRQSFFANVGNADHDVIQSIFTKMNGCCCHKVNIKMDAIQAAHGFDCPV